MSETTTVRSRRDKHMADDHLASHLACRVCQTMTDRETLGNLGAQCSTCYEAYCSETVPGWLLKRKPLSDADRKQLGQRIRAGMARMLKDNGNPKAWAYRLTDREEAGEKLRPALAEAWRVALRHDAQVGDES